MKKARLLIAVLVCSVMMLGIGYAWWNDTLTVSGTVETGKFDVNFIRT
ncbi:MAG TPA: signal peptide protein, partial [Clostridia bacterium]|nr:signal peptide protein [Clostridia bacterium]